MKTQNIPHQTNIGEMTPFEQFEAQQCPLYNECETDPDYWPELSEVMPRNNGTQAGFDALRISLARG